MLVASFRLPGATRAVIPRSAEGCVFAWRRQVQLCSDTDSEGPTLAQACRCLCLTATLLTALQHLTQCEVQDLKSQLAEADSSPLTMPGGLAGGGCARVRSSEEDILSMVSGDEGDTPLARRSLLPVSLTHRHRPAPQTRAHTHACAPDPVSLARRHRHVHTRTHTHTGRRYPDTRAHACTRASCSCPGVGLRVTTHTPVVCTRSSASPRTSFQTRSLSFHAAPPVR